MSSKTLRSRKALHEAIYDCTACRTDLGKHVQRVQPPWDPKKGAGSVRRWGMIVGQAPGRTERRRGSSQPKTNGGSNDSLVAFMGPAGRRLREWLVSAGFTENEIRREFWKTSVTKCYPGKRGRGDRVPTRVEIRACERFLESEIALVQPDVIITLGRTAASWFNLSARTLDEIVGQKSTWTAGNRRIALVHLPHPSPGSLWLNEASHQKKLNKALQVLRRARAARQAGCE